MADEKKTDDYKIDMPGGNAAFNRVPSPALRGPPQRHHSSVTDNAQLAILSYCMSSILMTVTNKYVLSGVDFNLNFFLLCVQVSRHTPGREGYANGMAVRRLCGSYPELQIRRLYNVPRLQ